MKRNLFKVKSILLTSLMIAALAGCGGGGGTASTTGDTNTNTGDTGGDTGGNTNTTGQLKVTVYGDVNTPLSGATVVLGDSNGDLISFATTGADGKVTFSNPPVNATVTAAYQCASGLSYDRDLEVQYDINAPEIAIGLWDCNDNSSVLGTVNVNVTSNIGGAAWWEIHIGNQSGSGSAFTLTSEDLQSDGKFSVAAIGYDWGGDPVAYGTALDQTFTNGMTIDITANSTAFTDVPFSFANLHSAAIDYFSFLGVDRNGADLADMYLSGGAPIPSTFAMKAISGGDSSSYAAGLNLDMNSDGITDAGYYINNGSYPTLDAQTFDFNASVMPTIPANLSIGGTAARPVFSWTGSYTSGDVLELDFYTDFSYNISMPPTSTSATFPELPDALADFRPNGISEFEVNNWSYDTVNGYDDVLAKNLAYYAGTWTLTGTTRMSDANSGQLSIGASMKSTQRVPSSTETKNKSRLRWSRNSGR